MDSDEGECKKFPSFLEGGWIRRHLVSQDRVSESIEIYENLGFEVKIESPQSTDFDEKCGSCAVFACKEYLLIYTRKK